jgi:hypothetical protein
MEYPMLRGRSILVVENELLIAMDIAQALERAGANAASSLRQLPKAAPAPDRKKNLEKGPSKRYPSSSTPISAACKELPRGQDSYRSAGTVAMDPGI